MVYEVLKFILDVVWIVIIAHIIMSWLVAFQVLNLNQPLVAQAWYGINRILEPIYAPIRRILPPMGGLDLAPMVLIIGVIVLRNILASSIGSFG